MSHVVNLGNVAVMDNITKIAAVETTTAIWEFDPILDDNHVLGGSLDVIAAIRTLAIKVWFFSIALSFTNYLKQIQASGQWIQYFEKSQIQCGISNPLKIPLHSNV